jgi:NAD(P)-dependent dehydrogenase (short-subunit alcohol dehydrogenase family)
MHLTFFITGCATGFGHALARAALASGASVVATDRAIDGLRASLLADQPGAEARLTVAALDVRRDDQVAAVVAGLAGRRVDVLVNNAGRAFFAAQEEGDPAAFLDLLDVNVVGVARVTRALLPALRLSRGVVVNLSSVAGRTVFPESGFYAASKHAVEAMSEALAQEVATFGVRVRVIEPGSFDTCFLDNARAASPPRGASSPYARARDTWDRRRAEVLELPQPPSLVVRAILASVDDPAPFRRVPVGPDAERLLGLRDALAPDAWVRLAVDRAGHPDAPHQPDEVWSAEEVIAARERGDSGAAEVLRATRDALIYGHLGHWLESPLGREAASWLASHVERDPHEHGQGRGSRRRGGEAS